MTKNHKTTQEADICLILEGTYPYVSGGVSSWVHDLIKAQSHLQFTIVSILSPNSKPVTQYDVPDNVIAIEDIYLQKIVKHKQSSKKKNNEIFQGLKENFISLFGSDHSIESLNNVIKILIDNQHNIDRQMLMDSQEIWDCMLEVYDKNMSSSPFIDFFWSWRSLLGAIYSLVLAPIPKAKAYHALCTGYAGIYMARANIETGRPCFVTEHGIYTNERRIEITSADWISDLNIYNLGVNNEDSIRDLKCLWTDMFALYSKLCYQHSSKIITLYQGNQEFQKLDGAPPNKMSIVPNGINFERFSKIKKTPEATATIALIGRIVPIKDIKTFIRSCALLQYLNGNVKAYIMGGYDEDIDYYNECCELVESEKLGDVIEFTGKVNILEYLQKIDVIVLTSVSEAQPLVILEAGAAGIPIVASDVGACREMIEGRTEEDKKIGVGGHVVELCNPTATSNAILKLLQDKQHYQQCSSAIKQRVEKYYNITDQHKTYHDIYDELINI